MQKAKILMPVLALALMLGLSNTAYAQLSCGVASIPVSRAADTGHTEPVGDLNFTCIGGANAVNTGTLTIDYGLIITNDEAGNQGGANIALTNLSGELAGATIEDVNNDGGQIVINLPPSGANPADSTLTVTGVLTSTFNQGLSNVIANVSTSAGSNYFINAGQNNATVINMVLRGIEDPSLTGDRQATVFTNGVDPDPFLEFEIEENFIDFFREENQYNNGLSTNDTQIELHFQGLFEDFELDCSISGAGMPALSPTQITDEDDVAVITFGADLDLSDTESVNVNCEVDQGFGIDLPLPAGNVTVQATLAPTGDALDDDEPLDGPTDGQIPRYEEVPQPAEPLVIVVIEPAVTSLLMPFVVTDGGFDTGIAVANTSDDPFGGDGAEPVDGTLTFTFMPQDGSDEFTYTTDASSPGIGLDGFGQVEAGGTYSVLLSELIEAAGQVNGFTGHIFIEADFTNGHGQGFISDFAGFTAAADVLVINLDRSTDDEGLGK